MTKYFPLLNFTFFIALTVLTQAQEYVPDANTVALYHFNEVVPDTAYDSSGNGNNGTATGTTIVDGKFGKARSFDGISNYISVADSASFDLSTIKKLTVEGWVYVRNYPPSTIFPVGKWGPGADEDDEWCLHLENDGKLALTINSASSPGSLDMTLWTAEPIPLAQWTHIAGVWDGNTGFAALYINGISDAVTTTAVTTIPHLPQPVWMGWDGNNHFNGIIDEVRISNKAREPWEFNVLPTDSLVAYYPFNGNANDESGNGHNGTVAGSTPIADRFNTPNSAYSFSGTTDLINTTFEGVLGSHARTISMWMRKHVTSTLAEIGLDYGRDGSCCVQGSVFGCSIYYNPSLTIGIDVQDGAIRYAPFADDGGWHHYVWVVPDTTNVRLRDVALYQDGHRLTQGLDWWNSQTYSENAVVNTLAGYPVRIGYQADASIDDIRIYNRALSASEINSLFSEGGWDTLASISGTKFNDLNRNGVKDSTEVGMSDWRITLSGTTNTSVLTDTGGHYSFRHVLPGEYTITEVSRFGWGQSLPGSGYYSITLTYNDTVTGMDFGNFQYEGSLSGTIFNDLDGDGNFDGGEPGLVGWLVQISPFDYYATTDSAGHYTFSHLQPGTYTVKEFLKQYWQESYPPTPGTHEITLGIDSVVTAVNFGNTFPSEIQDMSVTVAGGVARPGFQKHYGIMFRNNGTTAVSSTVTFIHPVNTTFLPSYTYPPHTSYDEPTRTVTWNVGSVPYEAIGYLNVSVLIATPPVVNIGDSLRSCAHIEPVAGDLNPSDNDDCETQIVQGSYDPNDKLVIPSGVGYQHVVPLNTELVYLIRFQNTGNDTAFNVVVRDTLDTDLDISTVHATASSHPYTFAITGNRELKFTFANINLLDSTTNEAASHGFVSYRVKPRAGALGALVENTASIYFDYNLPVRTNVVRSQIEGFSKHVVAGWNMISLPYAVEDSRKQVLFPDAVSSAFAYVGGYQVRDSLRNGSGYWLKFPAEQSQGIMGVPVEAETIAVHRGWNMIGSISVRVPVGSITSIPGGIVTSSFFGYAGSYGIADTIQPGEGYWVKVNQDGELILSPGTSASSLAKRIRVVPTSELPPAPPEENNLTVNEVPKRYALDQNYPNPFNPLTVIRYQLPVQSTVTLRLYNLLGQVVATLAEGIQDAGFKSIEWNAASLASGVYFYRIEATSTSGEAKVFRDVKKFVLLR